MDEEYYEDHVLSILRGREECADEYSSIFEFKKYLNDAALAAEAFKVGWLLWRAEEQSQLQHKIKTLLKHVASNSWFHRHNCLVQFWGAVKVEGSRHHLSPSHHCFHVMNLSKGNSWFRKVCMDHVYVVDFDASAQAQQLIGGVGRAYGHNKESESTPDLRLYSINEFPLRDEAARCGFRAYMALPLFDLHTRKCCGVLEILSQLPQMNQRLLATINRGLEIAELKSIHKCLRISGRYKSSTQPDKDEKLPEGEIREILELAIKAVPQLSLAQVWVPCKECRPTIKTNLCCMEMTSFISAKNKRVVSAWWNEIHDLDMSNYIEACEFHNQYMYLSCFFRNISDLSISKSPLVHYAWKARLSHSLAICLQSVNNSEDPFVIIQFFLQLKNGEKSPHPSSLVLLLRIIEMKLKSFKLVSTEHIPKELVAQSREPNAIEYESIDMLNVIMDSYKKQSESTFTTYLGALCCQRPSSEFSHGGWVFSSPDEAKQIENDAQNNLLMIPSWINGKTEQFMKIIAAGVGARDLIMQIWIPKMVDGRCYLQTSDQPYVLGCLQKGLSIFRKASTGHRYFVDEKAKEEELGPPGRVFRNEYPEYSNDLSLYSTKEFPMRNYAVNCQIRRYYALPIFDKYVGKCVRVLELIAAHHGLYGEEIESALKAVNLRSSPLNLHPRFIVDGKLTDDIPYDIDRALIEVKGAFSLIGQIPQLYLAKVWISYEKCASINGSVSYMELALTTECMWEYEPANKVYWINCVQPKKGMMGMLLESENKSCFCASLSEFSIVDQPQAQIGREKRLDVCFAICLQSSYTEDLLYVLEFFLNPSIDYPRSFFNFLLPIMKHELKSFRYSCGKQLGEELVVEVIEFCEVNNHTFSYLEQMGDFPFKFKRVQYAQMEYQQAEDELVHCGSNVILTEQCNTVASDPNNTERGKRKIGFHLSLGHVKSLSGKKLKDVAEELGDIAGPSIMKVVNSSFFLRENGEHSQLDLQTSSSSNLQLLETSLHPSMPHGDTESTQHYDVLEEAEKMIIKVKLKEDIIKFEYCLSIGLAKLFEEVAMRLKLEKGSFKLKYLDEDDDEVLLANDADFQYCSKTQIRMGKTCIQLFVR